MAPPGPVVETVSRKRVVPAAELENEKTSRVPDFWEYIESLKPDQWSDHIVYLYRQEPKTTTYPGAPPAYLEKYVGSIEVRPGVTVMMDDAGTIQQAIKEKFGGRVFRMILKKGHERLTETTFSTEAQPKYPDSVPQYAQNPLPNAGAPAQSDANAIATKAIDTVANQPQEMMNIAINALRASAEMIARSAAVAAQPPAAPAVGSIDSELDRAFKAAMIQKLLAPPPPPPDPFEMLVKLKQLMSDGTASNNSLMDKITSAAVEKILNPAPPAVSGRTTLLDLGREFIPVLGATVRETMHEYRLAREADVKIVELNRGAQPAAPAPAAGVIPLETQHNPNPQPAPAPVAAPVQQPKPTFQWVAERVAKIVKDVQYTTDEAVDHVLSFLYDTDERLVSLLLDPPKMDRRLSPGKQGLVQLFQYEPALRECMVNPPRVSEFIDKFIVAATEAEAAEAKLRAAAPETTTPPTPPN
jgi:hypothetical protein